MGEHIIDGEFQSDKYPDCPRGKVPLSTKDPLAQDLLWTYAQRRREVDAEFSEDLEAALLAKGFKSTVGPYLAAKGPGQLWDVWHEDECARDSVFMGSERQAIAVRDELNRLKGGAG